jgi:monooxygenase
VAKPFDVVIIGAGVSGIGMASRLSVESPDHRFVILERRQRAGGTWDLFRYPGVRSDSDMFTYGFQFRPWSNCRTLADGDSIRNYVEDTARHYGVDEHIEFGMHCTAAEWDTQRQLWTITATHELSGETRQWTARFIVSGQGYYRYDQGYRPRFANEQAFQGQIVHPQHWPKDLDCAGKKVVVIGSGATAVTVVPAIAKSAAQVTMLQRSPTYIFSLPGWDRMTEVLGKVLPAERCYAIARRRNLFVWRSTYKLCQRYPKAMRWFFVGQARRHIGDRFRMEDFNPSYDPWDQRLCAVPDADLFKAIRSGKADVVTDGIVRFTAKGLELRSGRQLDADIVVTATGLELQMFGGMQLSIDGKPYDVSKKMIYKGVLLQDLPNFAWILGYVNLSWTMKADMSSLYLCRLFKHMQQHQQAVVIPRDDENSCLEESVLDALSAGYIERSNHLLPRQGRSAPWTVRHDYEEDQQMMMQTPIADTRLETLAAPAPRRGKVIRRAA